eukprot:CAMPEP_0113664334 /NCGR_PEP_ID=MMETSP0038_2-20120614/1671_1 /TAXON_ID=2898 /ORGANISM="Cryptomonas paramecium" /LENGTH=59 /DNA_ID=CAMNT_0000579523 /DNA_START=298 /DNA_END=473 /DNA_ORIENTATION=- /assembly_acc=CAM_ASM_000170
MLRARCMELAHARVCVQILSILHPFRSGLATEPFNVKLKSLVRAEHVEIDVLNKQQHFR